MSFEVGTPEPIWGWIRVWKDGKWVYNAAPIVDHNPALQRFEWNPFRDNWTFYDDETGQLLFHMEPNHYQVNVQAWRNDMATIEWVFQRLVNKRPSDPANLYEWGNRFMPKLLELEGEDDVEVLDMIVLD